MRSADTSELYAKNISSIFKHILSGLKKQYRMLEYTAIDRQALPRPPSDVEKYLYSKRRINYLLGFSIISFVCISLSMFNFLLHHPGLWVLASVLIINVVYFFVSLLVTSYTKDFNVERHNLLVRRWRPIEYPTVDIFLPVCGEPLKVLNNTWYGVRNLVQNYEGDVTVYCLDDGASNDVRILARHYGYKYIARENRGYFKKAGNLRNAFQHSASDFIAIFDADFTPRKDFLDELLPYFSNKKIGIVQSPQFFDVGQHQNWLERGAGAVQELFYRVSQVSRQGHDASICVGSNAVYRRAALNTTGGTALIEHSEDVHTGFNLRMNGWTVQYVPIILAKGLCPSSMSAFFKQQYRWCMGSMSLMTSKKFWHTKLGLKARLSYISGFAYYAHTGLTAFYTPIVPLILLVFLPHEITLINYLLIFPALIFTQIIYPLWHRSTYGIEAWATRSVYGWAHLFAIMDILTKKPMAWQPTGTKVTTKKDIRYTAFRSAQILFNLIPATVWVILSAYYSSTGDFLAYAPIFISGIYYFLISSKVSFYADKHSAENNKDSTPNQFAKSKENAVSQPT